MSKKMIRRSLALGALMAFVITGSAFAETHYIIEQGGSVKQGSVPDGSSVSKGSYDYSGLEINGWNDFKDVEVFGEIYYPGSVKLEKDEALMIFVTYIKYCETQHKYLSFYQTNS